MARLPTDLQILEEIYKRYYPVFTSFVKETSNRSSKVYVSIDIREIADRFKIDADIVFGRLYYHLDQRYGFSQPDGAKVHFFAKQVGQDMHVVQFPLLASVLATLREEHKEHLHGVVLSIAAIVISFASLLFSILYRRPH